MHVMAPSKSDEPDEIRSINSENQCRPVFSGNECLPPESESCPNVNTPTQTNLSKQGRDSVSMNSGNDLKRKPALELDAMTQSQIRVLTDTVKNFQRKNLEKCQEIEALEKKLAVMENDILAMRELNKGLREAIGCLIAARISVARSSLSTVNYKTPDERISTSPHSVEMRQSSSDTLLSTKDNSSTVMVVKDEVLKQEIADILCSTTETNETDVDLRSTMQVAQVSGLDMQDTAIQNESLHFKSEECEADPSRGALPTKDSRHKNKASVSTEPQDTHNMTPKGPEYDRECNGRSLRRLRRVFYAEEPAAEGIRVRTDSRTDVAKTSSRRNRRRLDVASTDPLSLGSVHDGAANRASQSTDLEDQRTDVNDPEAFGPGGNHSESSPSSDEDDPKPAGSSEPGQGGLGRTEEGPVPPPLECGICGEGFPSNGDLSKHRRRYHAKKPHKRDQRGKTFAFKSRPLRRSLNPSEEKEVECDVCGEKFPDRRKLCIHRRLHAPKKRYMCEQCGKAYKSGFELQIHMRRHTGERPCACDLCDRRFISRKSLLLHRQTHSRERTHECETCHKMYPSKRLLTVHQRIHSGVKPYKCHMCDTTCTTLQSLLGHRRVHSGERPFKCEMCDRAFTWSSHLARHRRFHTGERPFSCTTCGKTFVDSSSLRKHNRISHSGLPKEPRAMAATDPTAPRERPFVCDTCGKTFPTRGQLSAHVKAHVRKLTGEKPYQCEQCDKRFSNSTGLYRHRRQHSGAKNYACTVCDKRYAINRNLKIHMRKHSGERPFKCDVCEKTFPSKHNLKIHMKRHTGDRPFKCDLCDKRFILSGHLAAHLLTHSEERRHACDLCEETFASRGTLKEHRRTHPESERQFKCERCDESFPTTNKLQEHLKTHDERADGDDPADDPDDPDDPSGDPSQGD